MSSWPLVATLLLASLIGGSAHAGANQEIAFLAVGNSRYLAPPSSEARGFRSIEGANRSARRVADILASAGGSGDLLLSDEVAVVARTDVISGLDRLVARDAAFRVVYLAGHGISEDFGWSQFFLPGDFTWDAQSSVLELEGVAVAAVPIAEIFDRLERAGAPFLLVVDACYEGTEAGDGRPVLEPIASSNILDIASALRILNEFRGPNAVIFAAAPGDVATTAPDPRDSTATASLAPLARRLSMIADQRQESRLLVRDLVSKLIDPELDARTGPGITRSDFSASTVLLDFGTAPGSIVKVPGTGIEPRQCCAVATSAAVDSNYSAELVLEGQPGSWLTDGAVLRVEAPPEPVSVERIGQGALVLSIGAWGRETSISLATADGSLLAVGHYEPVQRFEFGEGRPALDIATPGRSCNEVSGSFDVGAIEYGPDGRIQSLTADLRHRCDDETGITRGRASLRALAPVAAEP